MRAIATQAWDDAALAAAARDLAGAFPAVRLNVSGACMEPRIPEGRSVLLVDARSRRPRFGDVVLARQGSRVLLHRLVWAPPWSGAWRTQADRAACLDPRLRREDVLATVVSVAGRTHGPRAPARAGLSLGRSLLGWLASRFLRCEP